MKNLPVVTATMLQHRTIIQKSFIALKILLLPVFLDVAIKSCVNTQSKFFLLKRKRKYSNLFVCTCQEKEWSSSCPACFYTKAQARNLRHHAVRHLTGCDFPLERCHELSYELQTSYYSCTGWILSIVYLMAIFATRCFVDQPRSRAIH